MPNKKAQMSAPFELLIAIIIMGFVIFFGMNALNELNKEQCKNELDRTMHDLVNATELAVNQGARQSIHVKIPSCYSKGKLFFESFASSSICSAYCGGYRDACMLLKFETENESSALCVNISSFTMFSSGSSVVGDCPELENFTLIDPTADTGIPSGYYSILNVTPLGQLTPIACFYKQGA